MKCTFGAKHKNEDFLDGNQYNMSVKIQNPALNFKHTHGKTVRKNK